MQLQKWRIKLNFETNEVILDPQVTKVRLLSFHVISGLFSPESVIGGQEAVDSHNFQKAF